MIELFKPYCLRVIRLLHRQMHRCLNDIQIWRHKDKLTLLFNNRFGKAFGNTHFQFEKFWKHLKIKVTEQEHI